MTEINIYVKAIDTMESPYYEFYTDTVGTTELTPTNTLYTNNTYIFNRLNSEVSHPFFISDVGYEQESTSAITITTYPISSGSNDYLNGIKNNDLLKLEFNTLTSSDTLYYYCTSHSSMVSTFVLIDPPAAAIFNSYVNVNDNLIVTGNITLDGDISGSGASLYDIPNSGLVNNSITINSQNVALGESVTLIASQWTTDSNAIYYDGGNVGIQTSDPSYALDVSGSVNCSELLVNGTAPSFSGGSGSSYVQLDSTYVTSSETYANPSQNTISLETNNWNLDFSNNIYYNTGNVGIGVDTANFELDVSGSVNCVELLVNGTAPTFGGEYVLYDDTYQTNALDYREVSANITTTSSGVWDLSDSNTISYTNGNVGIGTDSPESALQVAGNIEDPPTTSGVHLGYSLNNSKIFLVPNTSTANSEIEFYSLDSGDYGKIEYDHTNNRLQFQTNSADRMTIDSDGNVGIGTVSPYELLTIQSATDIDATFSVTTQGAASNAILYLGTPASANRGRKCAIIAEGRNFWSTGNLHFCVYNGVGAVNNYTNASLSDSKMMITPAGYVGIGLTDPAYTLDVSGTVNCSELLVSGNVGIETTDPAYELDVSGDVGINGSLRIGGTKGVSAFMGYTDYSAYFGNYIYAPAIINSTESGNEPAGIVFGDTSANGTDEISLITYGITRVYIKSNGYVGIGTTSPTYTLHVAGSVGGTSFTTTSDDRLKSNEIPITDALENLMKLNPMTYDKYDNMDKSGNYVTESGLISQDIWYQVPELRHIVSLGSEYSDVSSSTVPTPIDVSNNELLEDADYNNLGWSTTTPSGVKYTDLIAYLIKAVQELNIQRQQEKDALQASHDSLQASHDSLKDEMAELKALLQEKSVI